MRNALVLRAKQGTFSDLRRAGGIPDRAQKVDRLAGRTFAPKSFVDKHGRRLSNRQPTENEMAQFLRSNGWGPNNLRALLEFYEWLRILGEVLGGNVTRQMQPIWQAGNGTTATAGNPPFAAATAATYRCFRPCGLL